MPNLTINLSTPGKPVSKYMYGLGTGGLQNNGWELAANSTAKASLAIIKPTLMRSNADSGFANAYVSGNTGIMNNWFNNYQSFCDPEVRYICGIGPAFGNTSLSPATVASRVTTFANAMKNQGHPITYWEAGNENQGMGAATYSTYFNAIADALHNVDPNYVVGGTVSDWWGSIDINGWANAIGNRAGFFCIHSYPIDPGFNATQIYNSAIAQTDIISSRNMLNAHSNTANIPIGLLEYNMNGAPFNGVWGIPVQATYTGAMYIALLLTRCFKSDANFTMGGIWDAALDGYFGVIGNQASGGNLAVITPQGYYLGAAGQKMGGVEVPVSGVSGNLQVLASKNGSNFAIQLINYDVSASSNNNITLTGGTPSGNITRWEIGKSSQNTPTIGTQASLASVTVPSETIVILTGTTASAPKSMTVNPIVGVTLSTPFTVSGTFVNFPSAPTTLLYANDGGSLTTVPTVGRQLTATTFSFIHPGMPTAGNAHTILISDGTISVSANYAVVDTAWQSRTPVSALTDTVTGLTPSTSYDFRVVATNSVGTGPTSSVITRTTSAGAGVTPSAPTSLRSTQVTPTTVTLAWTAPATGSTPITYRLQSSPAGAGTWVNRATGVSGLTVQATGLTAATNYDWRIYASNSNGEGVASAVYTIDTVSAGTITTWDAASKSATITLSNGNLTATTSGSVTPFAAFQSCRSTNSIASGKFAFEVTLPTITQNTSISVCNSNYGMGTGGGVSPNAVTYYPNAGATGQGPQSIWHNNVEIFSPSGSPVAESNGATITFLVDRVSSTTGLLWVTSPAMRTTYGANAYNCNGSANPTNGVAGIPISITGPLFAMFDALESGSSAILNAGSSAFTAFVPPDFLPLGGTGGATFNAPNAVTNLLTGVATNTTIPLSWVAPTSGTAPFTYHYQSAPRGSTVWTEQGTIVATPAATVTGLTIGTAYDFRVYAENNGGSGGYSNTAPGTTTSTVITGTSFADEFTTLNLYNTRNTAGSLANSWMPCHWYSDANGGPDGSIVNDGWLLNPFNPATPITDFYEIQNSELNFGVMARPGSIAAATVGNKAYISGTLHTQPTFRQFGGYFEVRVAVPNITGTMFAFWLMSDGSWPPELDICEIVSVQGGAQFSKFSLWTNSASPTIIAEHYTYNMGTPIDCTQYNQYGVDWRPDLGTMTFFINRVQQLQAPIPGDYTVPMFPIMSTYAGGSWIGAINNPGLLPMKAKVDYVRIYPTGQRPF